MIQRCFNSNTPEYKYYGARGITVCERWRDFAAFLEDMGERPSKKYSIDRINVNGNYEPENCRWADERTQHNNTRRNIYYVYNGENKTAAELARIAGIGYDTMRARLSKQGLTPEQAVKLPVKKWGSKKSYQQTLLALVNL